ncbi:Protein of unknown function [Gryllus bimaculatus]|nr:Protein of unknown function [Gryllus bimaculatus]
MAAVSRGGDNGAELLRLSVDCGDCFGVGERRRLAAHARAHARAPGSGGTMIVSKINEILFHSIFLKFANCKSTSQKLNF